MKLVHTYLKKNILLFFILQVLWYVFYFIFVNFPNNHDCGPVIKLEVPQFEKFVVPLEAKVSCFTPKHQWPLPQCSVAKELWILKFQSLS